MIIYALYYIALTCIHLNISQPNFGRGPMVSNISACTKQFRDDTCKHQCQTYLKIISAQKGTHNKGFNSNILNVFQYKHNVCQQVSGRHNEET